LAWFAGILVFAGAAAAGIWHRAAPETDSTRSPPVIPVTAAQARAQDVPIYLSAQGTVQAWNTIALRSQIDGK
jgi:membrane fusion protein, multidrug efflux system